MQILMLVLTLIVFGLGLLAFLYFDDSILAGVMTCIIGLFVLYGGYVLIYRATSHTERITITDKERTSGDDGQWVVFADNGNTYGVTDTLAFWNWRASDRYGDLKVGETYDCDVAGWRIGFFSEYKNLVHCVYVPMGSAAK